MKKLLTEAALVCFTLLVAVSPFILINNCIVKLIGITVYKKLRIV